MYNLLLISDCDLKKLHKDTNTAWEYMYIGNQMVMSEIWVKAREIIRIWTKRKWNYSLILRVYHLITY